MAQNWWSTRLDDELVGKFILEAAVNLSFGTTFKLILWEFVIVFADFTTVWGFCDS